MTKKHFKALAAALERQRPTPRVGAQAMVQWNMDVKAMADVCASFNGAFDRDRFIAACGGLFYV